MCNSNNLLNFAPIKEVWLDQHKDELMMNWERMENGETLVKINPLDLRMEQTNSLKWVTAARALDGYRLHLTFNDGCERIFNCLPLIEKYKLFAPLRDRAVFDHFDLDGWTVCWLGGSIDIAPEHLYEMGHAA